MIKGAIFTIGVLVAIGSVGYGVLAVMAGGMSDAPAAGNDEANNGLMIGGIGLAIGVAACIGAWLS